MNIEIDNKELRKVLNKYPEALPAIKELFPTYKEPILIECKEGFYVSGEKRLLYIRDAGNFRGTSFWLNPSFHWEVTKDEYGVTVLVPTR